MGRVGISSKTLITAAKVLQFGRHGRVRGLTVDFGRLEAAVEVGEAAQADSERQEEYDEGDDRCGRGEWVRGKGRRVGVLKVVRVARVVAYSSREPGW